MQRTPRLSADTAVCATWQRRRSWLGLANVVAWNRTQRKPRRSHQANTIHQITRTSLIHRWWWMRKNEVEWTEYQTVGKAKKAIFWSTPDLKEEICSWLWLLSKRDLTFWICGIPQYNYRLKCLCNSWTFHSTMLKCLDNGWALKCLCNGWAFRSTMIDYSALLTAGHSAGQW